MVARRHMLTGGLLLIAIGSAAADDSILPYQVHKKTLPNGFDVVVIATPEFKNVVSYNTLVLAGARNETEPGKSGLAHLFEHILFRHRFNDEEQGYNQRMDSLGTHNNAWTWFDVTYYHPLTFRRNLRSRGNLAGLVELEASRFTNLKITEQIFKTEAGAVLGEYRRIASDPSLQMSERMFALMFPHHPYGHTTLGYLDDVIDMPNEYQAAVAFYDAFYRPNNCVLVVAGDVEADEVFELAAKYYGDWKPKPAPQIKPTGDTPASPGQDHLAWDADVAPLVWVAWRTPAFQPGSKAAAVTQILNELTVSQAAPLYKRLRYETQLASSVGFAEGTQGFESFDPRALIVSARLYKEKYAEKGKGYFDEVSGEIVAQMDALKKFSEQPDAAEQLRVLKDKYRYDFLRGLSSPANIAATFSWYYRFDRDPQVLERLIQSVDALEPADIDAFAREIFVPGNRAIVTMAQGELTK